MKSKIKYLILGIIIGIILSLLFTWISALIKCETLTREHYDEFKDAYIENTMLGDMEYFKVLNYDEYNIAEVYYVSKDNTSANVLTFIYDYDTSSWEEISWKTIWSESGSASGIIFPYWWHFIYGGF